MLVLNVNRNDVIYGVEVKPLKKNSLVTLLLFTAVFSALSIIYFGVVPLFQQERHPVVIAVSKSPLSTPFYVAKAINAFDDTCVAPEYIAVAGGQLAFEKVMSGQADFATSSDSVIAFESLKARPCVTHAMFVQSDNDVKIITRKVDNIRAFIDLKGKRIGVTKGTASEYILSTLLAIEGLSLGDIVLQDYPPEHLIEAFRHNEVDAILPWEPFAFQTLQSLKSKIKIHDTKSLSTLSFNLVSQTAEQNLVEQAVCVIQGLQKAIHYITSYPEQAKSIVITELAVSTDFIDWVWPDYIFKLSLNQSLILNINAQANWAVATQMTSVDVTSSAINFIDSRALLKVDPGAVNISR